MDDIKLLRDYKDKYSLTWKQVAESLGLSEATVGNWYAGENKRKIPQPYTTLIRIFLEHPQVYKKHRLKTYL